MTKRDVLATSAIAPNQRAGLPLPDIQELRRLFGDALADKTGMHDRAATAAEYIAFLGQTHDLDTSDLHSRMFFRAAKIIAHTRLNDEIKGDQNSAGISTAKAHLASIVVNRVKLQRDTAEYFMNNPDIPPRKLYQRARGVIASANTMVSGQQSDSKRMIGRIFHGMLREEAILESLREHGYEQARQATVGEDVYRGQDIIIPGNEAARRLGIQVKSYGEGAMSIRRLGGKGLEVALGLDMSNPLQLAEPHTEKLLEAVEKERAA